MIRHLMPENYCSVRSKIKYMDKEDSPVDLEVPVGVWGEGKNIPLILDESGDSGPSEFGRIGKMNFYHSNKSVLSGNGKTFPFDAPLVGLNTFIHSQTQQEKSGSEKTFAQRV